MLKCIQSKRDQRLLNDAPETGKESAALPILILAAARLVAFAVFAAPASGKF